ncbi:MAG TPA: CRISPR system precrRNA processing endoribonuclease RAMP protein Cas6 [Ktedonobacteraceae bacterium]
MELAHISAHAARLYALQLRLRPVQHGTLMPFSGEMVHGAFLRWLRDAAPDVVSWLHEGQKRRFFTCSSLQFNRPAPALLRAERENIHLPLDPRETYTVRLTLLLSDLFPLLSEALAPFQGARQASGAAGALADARWQNKPAPSLQFGKQHCLLEDVILANQQAASWTGFTSLEQLVEQARQKTFERQSTLTLEFSSLTAFSRGSSRDGYGTFPIMLPLPELVFQNLLRRWEDIAPPALVGLLEKERLERYLQEDGVIIVDYDLKAHHVHFTTHEQRGFLGACTYQLRGPDDRPTTETSLTPRQQIYLLAQLAFYTGIGYKTTMGLGQSRIVSA